MTNKKRTLEGQVEAPVEQQASPQDEINRLKVGAYDIMVEMERLATIKRQIDARLAELTRPPQG